MTLLLRFLIPLFFAFAIVMSANDVGAQSPTPSLETVVSQKDVEEGSAFVLQFTVMMDRAGANPSTPTLSVPSGIVMHGGPTISSKSSISVSGSGMIHRVGVSASWTLEGTRPGKYRIGPPTVIVDGKAYSGSEVEVQVHPRGALPAQSGRGGGRGGPNIGGFGSDPFDIFDMFGLRRRGNPFDDPSNDPNQPTEPLLPPTNPELALTQVPSQHVFISAITNKSTVVLGEQVTFSVYEYFRTSGLRMVSIREASTPEFLQYPVMDPSEQMNVHYADVGSEVWNARMIRRIALFPIKSGTLTIGPVRSEYQGRSIGGRAPRETLPLEIVVQDPPAKGRPVGYRVGDVGQFTVSATVEPRQIEAGGAVSVKVKVEGTGNPPSAITMPSKKGFEWLDPEVKQNIVADDGRIRGDRVFSYILKLYEPGEIDLGKIELPYFDPGRRRYSTATGYLGWVTVKDNPRARDVDLAATDRFSVLQEPRKKLGDVAASRNYVTDKLAYWIALLSMPLAVVLVGTGIKSFDAARSAVRKWRESLDRKGRVSLRAAERAMADGRIADSAAEVERAAHAMIESATLVKSRGVLRSELKGRLIKAGASEAASDCAVSVFEMCELLRFDPSASRQKTDELLVKGRELGQLLSKSRKARP